MARKLQEHVSIRPSESSLASPHRRTSQTNYRSEFRLKSGARSKGTTRTVVANVGNSRNNILHKSSETHAAFPRCRNFLSDGKCRHDGRAAAALGFDSHFAAMRLHNSPDDRQPKTGAFGLRRAEHGTECAATLFFGHAFARVLELDGDARGSRFTAPWDQPCRDRQRAAMG